MLSMIIPTIIFTLVLGHAAYAQSLQSQKIPLEIVHPGDYFSSGRGARAPKQYGGGHDFNTSPRGCFRSELYGWGAYFKNSLSDVFAPKYINRACSNGLLKHITGERVFSGRLRGPCSQIPTKGEEFYRAIIGTGIAGQNRLDCQRVLPPKINAVTENVDIVLLTIRGNDAFFAGIVGACFVVGLRKPERCLASVKYAESVIMGFAQKLANTLGKIRSRMKPFAKIVFVSYHYLSLDIRYILVSPQAFIPFYDAGTAIRRLGDLLGSVQRRAADLANLNAGSDYVIFFGKSKSVFKGHEPDPFVLARNEDGWINEFEGLIKEEWYHPNPLGHKNWGESIAALLSFDNIIDQVQGTSTSNLDLAFVIDTTMSMDVEIGEVRRDLKEIVNQLSSSTRSFRVAIVSYREFPERTGVADDYPSRVDLPFSRNVNSIQAAIDSLKVSGENDFPKSVLSGISAAISLPWRAGVTKVITVIGDVPPLLESGAEPISGLTPLDLIAESIKVDPVQVFALQTERMTSLVTEEMRDILDRTGGSVVEET